MPWDLVITEPASRDLRKIPRDDLKRIEKAFQAMRSDPYGGDIKFLYGAGGALRRRVGTWRIFFAIHQTERQIAVLAVRRRTSTTYR
jgi:mRNA-degrading endonuclease RelE of RelBE toxin-antitoxin system